MQPHQQLFLLLLLPVAFSSSARLASNRLIKSSVSSQPAPPSPPGLVTTVYAKGLSDGHVIEFLREGHVQIKQLLDPSLTERLSQIFQEEFEARKSEAVQHYNSVVPVSMADDSNPPQPPFLQLFNTWRVNEEVRDFLLGTEALGKIASQLLDVPCVRLYQDSLFVKCPQHDATEWHSDLKIAPFNTNDFLTFWIPLTNVPSQEDGGTSLSYASRSHTDFALPFWFNPDEVDLSERYVIEDHGSYELGDVSVHHGWTLHAAPPNLSSDTRFALSLSYVADGAPLLPISADGGDRNLAEGEGTEEGEGDGVGGALLRRPDLEDRESYQDWLPQALEAGWLTTDLCPVAFGLAEGEGGGEEGDEQ